MNVRGAIFLAVVFENVSFGKFISAEQCPLIFATLDSSISFENVLLTQNI